MGIDNGFKLRFRRIFPEDIAILEKWYGMTNYFGYATGFKRFSEINQIFDSNMQNKLVLMIETGEDKKTIGFIYGELKFEAKVILWINILIIEPAYQHKGLGTCAVNKLLNFAKIQYGPFDCYVSVSDKNIQGLSFWQKVGFSHSDRMETSLNQNRSSHVAILERKIK